MLIKNKMHIKKYIAAYLERNAKPTKIPNKIKFFKHGLFLILNICRRERDQKRINKISVDTIYEENVTAGIRKKEVAT